MTSSCPELRRARPLLGTFVDIRAGGADRRVLGAAMTAAFCEIALVQRLMSFHDPDSDVSRINRNAGRSPVNVHPHTMEVLRLAVGFSATTSGAFDVTVAPYLVARGELPRTDGVSYGVPASWTDIELLEDCAVRTHRPLLIDLGGIAKGYAVDLAVEALRRNGAAWGCVNAGGDLRAFGAPQTVHIRHPQAHGHYLALTEIDDAAAATSGGYFADQKSGAIVDPRDGTPSVGMFSVTVVAARCVIADALTKIVRLLGQAATDCMRSHGAKAWVIDGEIAACDEPVFV